jgi:uridine monophosphate synthetase
MLQSPLRGVVPRDIEKLITNLHDIGAIKFGSFNIQKAAESPLFVDLHPIAAHPKTLELVASLMAELLDECEYDLLCGTPAALPLATALALRTQTPMAVVSDGSAVTGAFSRGDACVVVDDVVASGSSALASAERLRGSGLDVTSTIVLLDREQGGIENLSMHRLTVRPVIRIKDVVNVLLARGKKKKYSVVKKNVFMF